MQPERPECQCLACAQLQHHQANDTLLLFAIGTIFVVGGLVWLIGQVAGLLASGIWPDVPLSELPSILVRLPDHASDPAAAWPADAALPAGRSSLLRASSTEPALPPAAVRPAGTGAPRSLAATGSGAYARSPGALRPATTPCSPTTPSRGGGGGAA